MFASRITKDVTVQGDADEVVVTIQKLSGRSLEKGREAKQIASAAPIRAYGGDVMKALRSDTLDEVAARLAERQADPEAKRRARYDAYDRDAVLIAGIKRWTAVDDKGKDIPVTPDAIGDLDEETAQLLHEAILDLSLPPIDPAEAEALGKGV